VGIKDEQQRPTHSDPLLQANIKNLLSFDKTYIGVAMANKKSRFTKTMENGRLRLLPANKAEDTVEKLAPAFKEAAEYMIRNRFPGILSNAR